MSNKYNTTIKLTSGREVKSDIYIKDKYQVRSQGLNKDHVKDLVTALFNNAQFPDLNVLCTSKNGESSYYLVGGFHRVAAYQKALSIQKELRKIPEDSEEYTQLDEEQLHRRDMTLKPLVAQQVGHTFTFPISGNSEDESNHWKEVRAAAYLYGCTSNSDRTLGMSKADVGECMQKYLRLCRMTSKTQMAKMFNVDRKTVNKYCESIYREFKEEAVTRAIQLITSNPNISARELGERCPNLGGRDKVETFLKTAKFEGEDKAREVIFGSLKCPSVDKAGKEEESKVIHKTPEGSSQESTKDNTSAEQSASNEEGEAHSLSGSCGSRAESTKDSQDTSSNPPTEQLVPDENKQPNDVKTNQTGVGFGEEEQKDSQGEPKDSPEEATKDIQGAEVDIDSLVHRYINLELTIEDMQIMLDKGIYEEVKRVARKQAKGAAHYITKPLREELEETRESLSETSQKLNRVTRENEKLTDRITELEKQVTMIHREVEADTPVKIPGDSKKSKDVFKDTHQGTHQVVPMDDLSDLMKHTLMELVVMKRTATATEKDRIDAAISKKYGR